MITQLKWMKARFSLYIRQEERLRTDFSLFKSTIDHIIAIKRKFLFSIPRIFPFSINHTERRVQDEDKRSIRPNHQHQICSGSSGHLRW